MARRTYRVCCDGNGCQFYRQGLGKRAAAVEAVSHERLTHHNCTILADRPTPNESAKVPPEGTDT